MTGFGLKLAVVGCLCLGVGWWGFQKGKVRGLKLAGLTVAKPEIRPEVQAPTIEYRGRVEYRDRVVERVLPGQSQTPRICEDWVDQHGRFYFNQAARTLDVDQRFTLKTSTVQVDEDTVVVRGTLLEESPATGEILREWDLEGQAKVWIPRAPARKNWAVFVGARLDEEASVGPVVRVERKFPWKVAVAAEFSDTPTLSGGLVFEF